MVTASEGHKNMLRQHVGCIGDNVNIPSGRPSLVMSQIERNLYATSSPVPPGAATAKKRQETKTSITNGLYIKSIVIVMTRMI
jgi:hypothetical protein